MQQLFQTRLKLRKQNNRLNLFFYSVSSTTSIWSKLFVMLLGLEFTVSCKFSHLNTMYVNRIFEYLIVAPNTGKSNDYLKSLQHIHACTGALFSAFLVRVWIVYLNISSSVNKATNHSKHKYIFNCIFWLFRYF